MPQINIWINDEEMDKLKKLCTECKRSKYDIAKEALIKRIEELNEQRGKEKPVRSEDRTVGEKLSRPEDIFQ